jgi:hypothetical protein
LRRTAPRRALLDTACRARLRIEKPFSGEETARWLENYAHCRPAAAPRHTPWTGRRALGGHAALFRRDDWQFNFSIHAVTINPRNSFTLDQQNVFSLRHDAAGAIIMDSQDKFRPQHYTFILDGPDDLGAFCGGRIGNLAKPPHVEAIYSNGLVGQVAVDAVDSRRVIVRAIEKSVARARESFRKRKVIAARGLHFNLPLYVRHGASSSVGGREYVLGRSRLTVPVAAGRPLSILGGKVVIRPRGAAVIHYPCKPFNPYASNHKAAVDDWFMRLDLPMKGRPRSAQVEIEVRACRPETHPCPS